MALRTGSVVVPFTSETTASSWPVTALTRLDFPALRAPKKPMCVRSPDGVSFRFMLPPLLNEKTAVPQTRVQRYTKSVPLWLVHLVFRLKCQFRRQGMWDSIQFRWGDQTLE